MANTPSNVITVCCYCNKTYKNKYTLLRHQATACNEISKRNGEPTEHQKASDSTPSPKNFPGLMDRNNHNLTAPRSTSIEKLQVNPEQICMKPRHRNYVKKSSGGRPPKKKKRQIHTEWHFVEENWPPQSTESAERQNASQYIAVDDALQSDSSRVVKTSEFLFENVLYGELPNGGNCRDASTQTSPQHITFRVSINGEDDFIFHATPKLK